MPLDRTDRPAQSPRPEAVAPTPQERRVHLVSLGCARNRVDSEVMLGTLFGEGWQHAHEPESADVVIVNTCGFIGPAKEESVATVLEMAEYKKSNPDLKLVVSGCLTQRYKGQLAQNLPEVDLFVGVDEFSKIGALLAEPLERGAIRARRTHYIYTDAMPRVNTLTRHSAYVKVAEGCQHNCSFCIIPAIRGKLRSRPIESVCREVAKLGSEGVREVNLIAQDLAAYGRDLGSDQLLPLLRALAQLPEGPEWIRLLYVYPENIDSEFLHFLATEPRIVKYMDVPVQHAADHILRAMKRDMSRDGLRRVFGAVRAAIPGMALRTTVMVGFPGETDADFDELCGFVEEQRFTHLGAFAYSQEEGTVAARLPNQVEEHVKAERLEHLMAIQRQISREILAERVGQVYDVLIEGPSAESDLVWQGRLAAQAPEVDGVVYLTEGPLARGAILPAEITASHDYDLVGKVLPRPQSC